MFKARILLFFLFHSYVYAADEKNYYETLNLPHYAEETVIKKAYKKLALKLHPDKNPDPSATATFQELQEAYAHLSDPEAKYLYDLELQNKLDNSLYKRRFKYFFSFFDLFSSCRR